MKEAKDRLLEIEKRQTVISPKYSAAKDETEEEEYYDEETATLHKTSIEQASPKPTGTL